MFQGLFIDGFAGGGGASTGIAQAIGREVDIAMERYGSRDRDFIIDGQTVNKPAPRSNTHVTAISQEFALGLIKLVEVVAL